MLRARLWATLSLELPCGMKWKIIQFKQKKGGKKPRARQFWCQVEIQLKFANCRTLKISLCYIPFVSIGNSMISSAIWKKTFGKNFERLNWKKCVFLPKLNEKSCYYLLIIYMTKFVELSHAHASRVKLTLIINHEQSCARTTEVKQCVLMFYKVKLQKLHCISFSCTVLHRFCTVLHLFCTVLHRFCTVLHRFCTVLHSSRRIRMQ